MILDDKRTNILAFDPSMAYMGWVLYKPHEIVKYGCIRKDKLLEGQQFSGVMNTYAGFQIAVTQALVNEMKVLDPAHTHVVLEQPTGSQSSKAAWAMAMASTSVISTSIAMFRKKPILYTERDAKMHMFETATVSKKQTSNAMWGYWVAQGARKPEDTWPKETKTELRKCAEGVADAMLILNLHIHKIIYGLDIQN